jgi:hypothetical protein
MASAGEMQVPPLGRSGLGRDDKSRRGRGDGGRDDNEGRESYPPERPRGRVLASVVALPPNS